MNTDLINCIENYFDWPDNIIVLDLRDDAVVQHCLHYRPWSPEPEVLSTPTNDNHAMITMSLKPYIDKQIPCVFVTRESEMKHLEMITALMGMGVSGIAETAFGYKMGMEELDNYPPYDTSEQTQITIQSDEHHVIRNVNLPWEGKVECSVDDITFDVLIFSDGQELKETFRTQEKLSALKVKVRHGFQRDRLEVEGVNAEGKTFRLRRARKAKVNTSQLQSLNVIFDRTCVDDAAWSNAVFLSNNPSRTIADLEAEPSDNNKIIRTAMADTLTSMFSQSTSKVSVWCVNDVHDALGQPSWLSFVPQTSLTAEVNRPVSEVEQIFDNAFWLPGYDLWDPMGPALQSAIEEAVKTSSPIVIVGDSPPFPSGSDDDPMMDISKAFGFSTAIRRFCDQWRKGLAEATEHQIPVIFVFLTHSRPSASAGQDRIEAWNKTNILETAICNALEKEPLHLIKHRATAQGIQKAFQEVQEKMFVQHSDRVIRVVR